MANSARVLTPANRGILLQPPEYLHPEMPEVYVKRVFSGPKARASWGRFTISYPDTGSEQAASSSRQDLGIC